MAEEEGEAEGEGEGEEEEEASVRTPSVEVIEPAINPALAQLLQEDEQRYEVGVEEIFDIMPLYGTLKPGDSEQITLTFFGHADIACKARAVCTIEGGPEYEVTLKGEASLVDYRFDTLDIDYGKVVRHYLTANRKLTSF